MDADPNYPSGREFLNKLDYEPNVDYLYRPSYQPNLDYVYKPVERPNYDYLYKPIDSKHYGELYDESTLDLTAHLQSRSHCQNPYRLPPNCTVRSSLHCSHKCCKGQATESEDRYRKSVADENHEYAKRFPFLVDKSHVETINDAKHKKISGRLGIPSNEFATVYVEKCTSMDAVFDAHRRNPNRQICVLNFANSIAPGGEYSKGKLTQEASLCLQTLLYPTLDGNEMYTANRRAANEMEGSDIMIYSPNVSVFRDQFYKELVHPFKINVISATPVDNRKYECVAGQKIMERRIRKIINLAAYKHAEILILGAFGCGVYKNDPKKISKAFYNILEVEGMKHHFQQVIIPVSEDPLIFDIFNSRFHHQ